MSMFITEADTERDVFHPANMAKIFSLAKPRMNIGMDKNNIRSGQGVRMKFIDAPDSNFI